MAERRLMLEGHGSSTTRHSALKHARYMNRPCVQFAAWWMLWTTCCGIVKPVEAGASAYVMLEELAAELDDGCFIEIGSDRGEGSTKFLSELANRTHRSFFSVDFSPEGYENALSTCGSCAFQDMGERWLEHTFPAISNSTRIALAYLDNYDWTYPWTTDMAYKKQQHVDYASSGLKLSNQKSQEIHLKQAVLVERLCSERCFVLFDDTWPSASLKHHSGKGGRALSFLLSHGFEIVQQSAPNELSYLGYVLVRRVIEEERPLAGSLWQEEEEEEETLRRRPVLAQSASSQSLDLFRAYLDRLRPALVRSSIISLQRMMRGHAARARVWRMRRSLAGAEGRQDVEKRDKQDTQERTFEDECLYKTSERLRLRRFVKKWKFAALDIEDEEEAEEEKEEEAAAARIGGQPSSL
uniref:Methyltransferase domain-containing protein n=1 Tax=Hanusia phi TaxID=3032 RepID=A0A7S0E7C7_9CRYP|mmetsp:Transcript_18352/g.41799  ORF Transcript_18352/g.41799 Transcript_18352/m.41799 type:complete len:411 (+) Transcript_18352:23-1255(+)